MGQPILSPGEKTDWGGGGNGLLHRDINSTNLPCLTSVWPGDKSDSRNSRLKSDEDVAIASVSPSVRPSRYLLLNHWTKSSLIWCVSCSHKWGIQRHIFCPPSLGPGEGPKVRYYLISVTVNFKYFQTKLCVPSHK